MFQGRSGILSWPATNLQYSFRHYHALTIHLRRLLHSSTLASSKLSSFRLRSRNRTFTSLISNILILCLLSLLLLLPSLNSTLLSSLSWPGDRRAVESHASEDQRFWYHVMRHQNAQLIHNTKLTSQMPANRLLGNSVRFSTSWPVAKSTKQIWTEQSTKQILPIVVSVFVPTFLSAWWKSCWGCFTYCLGCSWEV